jgi:hypothetical protein
MKHENKKTLLINGGCGVEHWVAHATLVKFKVLKNERTN